MADEWGQAMRRIPLRSALTFVLLATGAAALAGVSTCNLTANTNRHGSEAMDVLWDATLHEWMQTVGPVEAVRVTTTELSDDGQWTELSSRPLVEFHYDRAGRVIRRVDFRDDGTPAPGTVYVYGDSGRLNMQKYYDAAGEVYIEATYSYDGRGRPAEVISYNVKQGTLLSRKVYEYAPGDEYVAVREYWGATLREELGYVRGARGRVVECRRLSLLSRSKATPGYAGRTVFSYDAQGNLTAEISYTADGKVESQADFSYEFDTYGNWVKRTSIIQDIGSEGSTKMTQEITYRTITYHR